MVKREKKERLGFDARGRPRWEERTATGEYRAKKRSDEILGKLKADDLALAETRRLRALHNPYGNNRHDPKPLKTRSKLDYMRALSESIKFETAHQGRKQGRVTGWVAPYRLN